MWVHPDFRRRGVGHSLVARALAFLRSAGQQHVSLWVTETHAGVFKFYENLGFQRTGARSPLRSGSDTTILEMARLVGTLRWAIGLDPVTGLHRHERWRDHLALHAQLRQLPVQGIAGQLGA
jgi:hypothetical protein